MQGRRSSRRSGVKNSKYSGGDYIEVDIPGVHKSTQDSGSDVEVSSTNVNAVTEPSKKEMHSIPPRSSIASPTVSISSDDQKKTVTFNIPLESPSDAKKTEKAREARNKRRLAKKKSSSAKVTTTGATRIPMRTGTLFLYPGKRAQFVHNV